MKGKVQQQRAIPSWLSVINCDFERASPFPHAHLHRDGSRGQLVAEARRTQAIVNRATGTPGEAETSGHRRGCCRKHRSRCIHASSAAAVGRRHRLEQRIGWAVQRGGLNVCNRCGDSTRVWTLPEAVPESRQAGAAQAGPRHQ